MMTAAPSRPPARNMPTASPLSLICVAHGLRCCSDRAWTFVLPLFLASVSPGSLAPTSALSLAQSLGVIVLAPLLARAPPGWMWLLVVLENACVLCGGAALFAAGREGQERVMRTPLFWCGCALMSADAAISSLLSVLVEKEYVRRLWLHSDSAALARANAMVVRVDLASSVSTYALLAVALRHGLSDGVAMLMVLGAWHLLSAGAVLSVLVRLRHVVPALADADTRGVEEPAPTMARTLRDGRRLWASLEGGARRALAAYVCLFFTVLSPSGLLSAHLRGRGVAADAIATFRSAAQLAGCLGTVVAPRAIRRHGVAAAGVWLQRLQLAAVTLAALAFWAPWRDAWPRREVVVMGGVVASRLGLWSYDLCERQLLQQLVPPEHAVLLFNFERALAEGAGLLMMLVSLFCPAPEDFAVLVALSVAAVASSSALLAVRPTPAAATSSKRVD